MKSLNEGIELDQNILSSIEDTIFGEKNFGLIANNINLNFNYNYSNKILNNNNKIINIKNNYINNNPENMIPYENKNNNYLQYSEEFEIDNYVDENKNEYEVIVQNEEIDNFQIKKI